MGEALECIGSLGSIDPLCGDARRRGTLRGSLQSVVAVSPNPTALVFPIPWHKLPIRVKTATPLGDGELYELSLANRELRIERSSDGELIIMSPTGGETGRRNANLTRLLGNWSERDGTGIAFDSSTGFVLPNGAMRAPDASWVRRERWLALTDEQRSKFPPLCPDFVVELLSPTDPLVEQRAKMAEYIESGAALGWLIDPGERRVDVYRSGASVVTLDDPSEVSADPILVGFVLRLAKLW